MNWVHRCFAVVVVVAVAGLAVQVRKKPELKKIATGLLAVLTLQVLTGAVTVQFDWPLLAAVAHNAGAALLVCLLAMLNYCLSFTRQSVLTEPGKTMSQT